MKIYIASDHRGIKEKIELINHLNGKGYNVKEIDIQNSDFDDYPDFAFKVGEFVSKDKEAVGILLCGNGIGMSIAANKVHGIRCARIVNKQDAINAKSHNGANIIALGADLDINLLKELVDTYLNAPESSEEKHIRRINKIIKYEELKYNEL